MKKIIFKLVIIFSFIFLSLILYLSIIGVKTKKFNSKIISQIKSIEPNIELKINDVSAKLNLFKFTIDAKTVGTDLTYHNIIQLENIKFKISLRSLINKEFALSEISLSSKSLLIKDFLRFLKLIKKDPKLFIAEQFVENGYLIADLKIEFDQFGKIKKNYNINGIVNNGRINILNKKRIDKIDFIFQISDKEIILKDASLLFNDKEILIPELIAERKNNEFIVSGKLRNKSLNIKEKDIKDLIDKKFFKVDLKEIIFSSDNEFKFKIDQKLRFKDLNLKSNINLDLLRIDNFFKLKNFFPNIKENIELKNQNIKFEYSKDKINILGSGYIFIQDHSDDINYKITKDKKGFVFDSSLKISKNAFLINLLNYKKKDKSTLELLIKGTSNENKFFFNEISLIENKNFLSIKDLALSSDFKINEIKNIRFDYVDKENLINNIEVRRDNIDYKITGNSFNLNTIIKRLLDSNNKKKFKYFSQNFKLNFDIKSIFLDKNNKTNNLRGSLILNNNEITELDLVSKFPNEKMIKLTIKTNDKDEKITALYSSKAKPLVDRYKFIKGFENGDLRFYSVKKNGISNSTLTIDNFKVQEIPVLAKLLTLASLQGIADLLTGEGIRFTDFEMKFSSKDKLMTIDEIYAIGPAISILMEGYIQSKKLISLRGTLVPATTINRTISSIPLIGNILVGKKVGEGVFGVSFKIKGPPGDLETTVNPIKTLTPRFITRTLEKIKKN